MITSHQLRPFHSSDQDEIREIYAEAIEGQCQDLYTCDQIRAWSSLAWMPGLLDGSLRNGNGWVSCENNFIAAFAFRDPLNRLALLYCRTRFAKRGHATALLNKIEKEAQEERQFSLLTEASLLSYPLLLRRNWILKKTEVIEIAGVSFKRFLMEKYLLER